MSDNVTSFHNFDDYGLASGRSLGFIETHWEENQEEYKPDESFSNSNYYDYDPALALGQRCQLVDAFFVGRKVLDPHESMALVARPRSKAVGALAGVQGSVKGNFDLSVGPLAFSPSSDDHSGHIARRVQQVWTYYRKLGQELQVIPTSE